MSDNEERWYVQFDTREVRLMTLEELDEAFQQGQIHENTFLIKVGETEWQTLADALGDGAEEEAAPAPAPVPAPAAVMAAPARSVAPAAMATAPAAASGWPPVVSMQAAPMAASPSIPPSFGSVGPKSTVPVVQDLSDLDLDAPFKSRRRGVWLFAAAVVAAVAGGGYALTRLDAKAVALPEVPAAPAAAALTPFKMPEPVAKPAPPPSTPTTTASTTTTASSDTSDASAKSGSRSLSDDMKKALIASDETRKPKRSVRATTRRSAGKAKAGKSGGGPFRSGGSANDPLNSKL